MTTPLRPSSSQTPPPVAAVATAGGSRGTRGPSAALARPAGPHALLAAPTATSGNEAAPRRPRSGAPQRLGFDAGLAVQSPALTQATAEARAPLDELRQLAGQLQGMEQEHARALLEAQGMEGAGTSMQAAPALTAEPPKRLAHRLHLTMDLRRHCQEERADSEAELAQIDRKLAKLQQRLDKQLALQAAEATAAPASRTAPPQVPHALVPTAPEPTPASAEIKEAKARLATLEHQIDILDKQFRNMLNPRAKAAQKAVTVQLTSTEELLADGARAVVNEDVKAGRLELRQRFDLPDIFAETPAGAKPPFDTYLARFTEKDSTGALQLRPDLLQSEQCSTLLLALCEAATCSVVTINLLSEALCPREPQVINLRRMVMGRPDEAAKALGDAVSVGLDRVMEIKLPRLITESANQPGGPIRRQDKAVRRNKQEAAERAKDVLALLQRYRPEVHAGLLRRAARIISIVADDHRGQTAVTGLLERDLDACNRAKLANLQQAQALRTQRDAERARLQALKDAQRAEHSTAAPASAIVPPAAAAAGPLAATTVPAGPDREGNILKLSGELGELIERRTAARNRLDAAVSADQSADRQERKDRATYEAGVAAWGREQDSARREREEARARRTGQRVQLAELEHKVSQAREALMRHPALTGVLEPTAALQRAIERHVEPDDAALRQRARRDTGYAGAYHSLGHLVEAVCDIHEDALRHCPGLFAARSQAEFNAAAATLKKVDGKGSEDRVCTHAQAKPIARGYSNALDQTERAVPVTASCYSLCWHQGGGEDSGTGSGPQGGRVLISHLYPLVPHRRLQTLEP